MPNSRIQPLGWCLGTQLSTLTAFTTTSVDSGSSITFVGSGFAYLYATIVAYPEQHWISRPHSVLVACPPQAYQARCEALAAPNVVVSYDTDFCEGLSFVMSGLRSVGW